jgi:asparagine synthase (glutamine-hydrolysing)
METPVATWFRGEIPELVAEALSPSSLRSAGLFDPAVVARLLEHHRSGRADHGRQLAGVVALQIWRRHFLESDGSAPTV